MAITHSTERPWLMTDDQLLRQRNEFIKDYFGPDGEIFQRPYGAGYWLYGVEYRELFGWLAFEFDETTFDPRNVAQHAEAIKAWKAGMTTKLPPNYYRLDPYHTGLVFDNYLRRWGELGLDDLDLPRADEALQWTILGEHRYG